MKLNGADKPDEPNRRVFAIPAQMLRFAGASMKMQSRLVIASLAEGDNVVTSGRGRVRRGCQRSRKTVVVRVVLRVSGSR